MGECDKRTVRLKHATAACFGYEWSRFPAVAGEYEANFLSYVYPLNKESFAGKRVLDAGCGGGRHAHFAARYGADVVAFDLSAQAVAVTRRNTESQHNVRTRQADLLELPIEWHGAFDLVMCIGVLHHLPDPEAGFRSLVGALVDGGKIAIWVYGTHDNKLARWLYEPLRRMTTRLPHDVLYGLALVAATCVHISNVLRLPAFRQYSRFPFRTKWNDAFDVMAAPSSKYYSLDDVRAWFTRAGLKDVRATFRELNGVTKGVRGLGVR